MIRRLLLPARPLRRQDLAPLAFLVLPMRQLWNGWAWDRATGFSSEALYSTLYAGGQVRRWFTGAAEPLSADLAVGSGVWLPEHLLAALWQAGVGALTDEGFAWGALLYVGVVLAGYGTWRFLQERTGDTRLLGLPLFAALLVQLSPAVIRAGLASDIGILALGPVALALCGSGTWALVAGLCSPVAALATVLGAVLTRQWRALVALVPLVAFLAVPPSSVPGAARYLAPPEATVPAYVGDGGAVLPLPPAEVESRGLGDAQSTPPDGQPPLEGAPDDQAAPPQGAPPQGSPPQGSPPQGMVPPTGGSVPGMPQEAPEFAADPLSQAASADSTLPAPEDLPARWPAGLSPSLALLAALILGRDRRHALAAVGVGALVAGLVGWTPVLGQSLAVTGPLVAALPAGLALPGLGGVAGQSAWLVGPLLLLALAVSRLRVPALLMGLVAFEAISEAPLHEPQVAPLAPEPATMALLGIPAGKAVVFPSPVHPWHQGERSTSELLFRATRHTHPLEIGLGEPGDLSLVLSLSRQANVPVDQGVAEAAWAVRQDDPWGSAVDAGYTGLLVDQGALDGNTSAALDGWIAGSVGQAFVSQGDWAVYGLVRLEPGGGGAP